MRIPMITAHSGCEGTARDSLDSVECAIRLGADVVEMDIRKASYFSQLLFPRGICFETAFGRSV